MAEALALKKGEVKDISELMVAAAGLEKAPEGFVDEVETATTKLLKKLGKTVAKAEREAKKAEKKAAKVEKLKAQMEKLNAALAELASDEE